MPLTGHVQKLERALVEECLLRQEAQERLKELEQFVVATASLGSPEAKLAELARKAEEIKGELRLLEKKAVAKIETLEQQAAEAWVEERGLGPEALQTLPSAEQRGDHLFVEPSGATTPTKQSPRSGKPELIIGHS